jgi:hypothetical protein
MRLGQLARKLSISQSDVLEFLSRNNIQLEADSNTRVTDADSMLVIRHFNPSLLIEEKEEQLPVTQTHTEEPKPIEHAEVKTENLEFASQPLIEPTPFVSGESTEEKIELIKAFKAELPGLKVLGKIDLPEPKKKEEAKNEEVESVDNNSNAPASPSIPKRSPRQDQRKKFENKKEERWKNPLEAKREREAKEAEQNRREQIKIEKELRTKHYNQKVKKTYQPTRAVKKVDEPLEEMSEADERPVPRTWFGKFWRWLSTP